MILFSLLLTFDTYSALDPFKILPAVIETWMDPEVDCTCSSTKDGKCPKCTFIEQLENETKENLPRKKQRTNDDDDDDDDNSDDDSVPDGYYSDSEDEPDWDDASSDDDSSDDESDKKPAAKKKPVVTG